MPFETLEAKIKLVPPQYFQELADFADFLAYKAKRIEFESDERILESDFTQAKDEEVMQLSKTIMVKNKEAYTVLAK